MHKIEITMTGGHGCDRSAKEGDELKGCGSGDCPDCVAAAVVDGFKTRGVTIHAATITHWPDREDGGIVDDLVAGKRKKGSF
jgi:hypothetical protein